MSEDIDVRESIPDDTPAIEKIYLDVFPEEDLLPLVRELLADSSTCLSLVAVVDRTPVAHACFTLCGGAGNTQRVALLGPVAVASAWQRHGIGGRIIRDGIARMRDLQVSGICVLGDPGYYGRLGFRAETGIVPPYNLPAEYRDAWQSVLLRGSEDPVKGTLVVPPPWQHAALWSE